MSGVDVDKKYFDRFIERIEFHGGDISIESLRSLTPVLDGPAIFYLALPPGVFADAAEKIAQAGLADETNGFRRLVIEKPFGTDLDTALALNEQLHSHWREDQIFRIDHFLGKETVQNMLVFRFANRFIEPVLNSGHVDEIQITVAETLGVEGRSRYYDGIGALRDMVQNHLIQMLTFATMEPPALWDAEMIRDHKVEVLKSVHQIDPDVDAVRGQYTAGLVEGQPRIAYRAEPGVDPTSHTDTFSAIRLHVDTWRWEGIPVLLRSGKRLAAKAHEVVFRFREPPTRSVPAHAARARPTELAGVPHEPARSARSSWCAPSNPGSSWRRGSRCCGPSTPPPTTSRRAHTNRCSSTCWRATTRRSCASTRSSGRGASCSRSSTRGSTGTPEDYVAGSDGPAGPASLPRPRPLLAPAAESDLLNRNLLNGAS